MSPLRGLDLLLERYYNNVNPSGLENVINNDSRRDEIIRETVRKNERHYG